MFLITTFARATGVACMARVALSFSRKSLGDTRCNEPRGTPFSPRRRGPK